MRNTDEAPWREARSAFLALWACLLLMKVAIAMRLPLFVDEAFYWQESRHLAWAYSDLPGLTAWLIRAGDALLGEGVLALRAPFLLIASLLPWLVVRITAREFDARSAWLAGSATMLLPIAGTLGLLALPDAAMALATLLCLDAGARLVRRVSYGAVVQLAAGLAMGALTHYRFVAVIAVGALALLLLPGGRRAMRDPRVWIAIAFGAAAWAPLLAWNIENADAGLRFQLVDRHPWAWHPDGLWFVAIQALLATPLLFAAMVWGGRHFGGRAPASGADAGVDAGRRFLALSGLLLVGGFFVLGFFADTERVSFHWPLTGYLALLPLVPAVLATWPAWARRTAWALAGAGLVAVLGYFVVVSSPALRERTATLKWYPSNFAGWTTLAGDVRATLATMPADTRVVADNFKIGAELGFALRDPRIAVLEHPLNRAHGRAPQLRLWGLEAQGMRDPGDTPVLLVVGASDVEYKYLLLRYHALCRRFGPLPPPTVRNIDHGRTRYLLFAIPPRGDAPRAEGPCVAPALAWIDQPTTDAPVGDTFEVSGWAFKDGAGLARVEVLVDGAVVAQAEYGLANPGVADYWKISVDPGHPAVGFRATIDASSLAPGRHWLGLRLHGRDGSIEDWSEQPFRRR